MNATTSQRPLACLKTTFKHARQGKSLRTLATAAPQPSKSTGVLPPGTIFHGIRDSKSQKLRTGFAIYGAPSLNPPQPPPSPPSGSSSTSTATAQPTKPDRGSGGKQRTRNPTTLSTSSAPPPTRKALLVNPKLPLPKALMTAPPTDPLPGHHALQISGLDPTGVRTRLFDRRNPDAAHVGDILAVSTTRTIEPFAGVLISIRRRGVDTAILLRGQLAKTGVEMWFKIYSTFVTGIEVAHRREKRARRARLTYMRKPEHDIGSVDELVREARKARNILTSVGAGGGKKKGKAGKVVAKKGGKGGARVDQESV